MNFKTSLNSNPTAYPRSLVRRLVGGTIFWAVPVLLIASVFLILIYRNSTYRIFDDPLVSTITALIASVDNGEGNSLNRNINLSREPIDPRYQQGLSGRYWIIGDVNDDGQVVPILASRSLLDTELRLGAAMVRHLRDHPGEEVRGYTRGADEEEYLRIIAREILLPDMEDYPLLMLAAADVDAPRRAVQQLAFASFSVLVLLSLGLVLAIISQVRSGLSPLFTLRDQVADIREGRSEKINGTFPREIHPLARELNSLMEHNKNVVSQARTHVSNLAHALKTPLAVLQNEVEIPSDQLVDIVSRQTDTMKNQVEHHLRRARAAARGQAIGVSTQADDVIFALKRTLERIYKGKDLNFIMRLEADIIFRGEKRDLEEMVGNLMDNACKWTSHKIVTHLLLDKDDPTRIIIEVEDDGPGLNVEDYEKALERGHRLDEATPGTGFGLPIVNDLAKAYNGSLKLGRSEHGGLWVQIILPGRLK